MFKKVSSFVCNFKRRILREMNTINKAVVISTTAVIFIAGLIITLHGICDITDSTLIFPRAVPPSFFLVIGRLVIHFALGLVLGILLAVGDRAAQNCAVRAAVFISLLVLCEMVWISVFYSFAVPFFSFLLAVFMLFLTVCACLMVAKVAFSASLLLYAYMVFLILRCWFSLSMVLIN